MTGKIYSFTQLRLWQGARVLAVEIYKFTENFPSLEQFGLTSQIRRSSVSVAANIAEGFLRNTAKEKLNFYSMALGSLTETQSHAYIASDLDFLTNEQLDGIINSATELSKMINGLKKTAQGRNT